MDNLWATYGELMDNMCKHKGLDHCTKTTSIRSGDFQSPFQQLKFKQSNPNAEGVYRLIEWHEHSHEHPLSARLWRAERGIIVIFPHFY